MKNKTQSNLDKALLSMNSKYPINGTYLQKYQFVSAEINNIKKYIHESYQSDELLKNSLSKTELSTYIDKEKENLMTRALAESGSSVGRFFQYVFSFYPYDND